jgi:hypothetical protein
LPASLPTLARKRGNDLRAPAARVEAACASSFPATAQWRHSTYATGIATCLADRNLDLLEERLGARIDVRSTAAGPSGPDPKIFALILCHGETIDVETNPRKSCQTSIVSNRVNA